MSLADLPITPAARAALERAGIYTRRQLRGMSIPELLDVPGVGTATVDAIAAVVDLAPDPPRVPRPIGRPRTIQPLLGLGPEEIARHAEGEVTPSTERAARRWLTGAADMGLVRVVRVADGAGLDLAELVRELARRRGYSPPTRQASR